MALPNLGLTHGSQIREIGRLKPLSVREVIQQLCFCTPIQSNESIFSLVERSSLQPRWWKTLRWSQLVQLDNSLLDGLRNYKAQIKNLMARKVLLWLSDRLIQNFFKFHKLYKESYKNYMVFEYKPGQIDRIVISMFDMSLNVI